MEAIVNSAMKRREERLERMRLLCTNAAEEVTAEDPVPLPGPCHYNIPQWSRWLRSDANRMFACCARMPSRKLLPSRVLMRWTRI